MFFKALFLALLLVNSAAFSLSVEEKVGQLLLVSFDGDEANLNALELIQKAHVGGILYFSSCNGLTSPEQVQTLSDSLQALSSIPLFIAVDQEGGRVQHLKNGFQILPTQQKQALEPENILSLVKSVGRELKSVGVNINLSPVVDVNVNPLNPVIGDRSYSHDPEVVVKCARLAIKGYLEEGIICCIKHFPGHGDTTVDSHLALPVISKSVAELNKVELYPFQQLCQEVDMIMTGHLLVPALDEANPATHSSKILQNLLREKLGFEGVIVSDSLIMKGLYQSCPTLEEAALRAFKAGCDLLCIGGRIEQENGHLIDVPAAAIFKTHRYLVDAVNRGDIPMKRLDESVERILALKKRIIPHRQM